MWHIQFFKNGRWCNLGLPLPSYELANQTLELHRSPPVLLDVASLRSVEYRAVFRCRGR